MSTNVLLKHSTWPLICGWYMELYRFRMTMMFHTPSKNREANWGPLSVLTVSGGPYTKFQSRQNADETTVAVMPARGTARTSFENRSTMIRRKKFPALVSVSGPRRSIYRLEKGSVAGNNLSINVGRLGAILSLAQAAQLATQSYTSEAMDSQWKWRLMEAYIRLTPG